jgi:transcriptional regulator with GAF, ATPase, and Fis domain
VNSSLNERGETMLKWEEIKHIHVLRKLEQILGNWYHVEVYYVDENGRIQNEERFEQDDHRNSFGKVMTSHSGGIRMLRRFAEKTAEKSATQSEEVFVVPGPMGVGSAVASPIVIDKECLGTVIAVGFFTGDDKKDYSKYNSALGEAGIPEAEANEAFDKLKQIDGEDKNYFQELVGLISHEIVTFKTEIEKRDERIHALNSQLGERYRYHNMIGKSKPMQELYNLLDKIKQSESTVLIQGQNGTGKELIAKAVHFNSPRKDKPFITSNCTAFNENLLESELFGHVRGAFTGAVKDKKGLFESAHKGTLFLDEIGDMTMTMQVKLLRVLQEGTFTPVGSNEMKKVDVRILCATNKDLKTMVEDGSFREDLYYRINVINVHVPPLRERKEDIPVLIEYFMDKACQEKGIKKPKFHTRAMEKLLDYHWPGNVRELENEIERLIVLCPDNKKISPELLSSRIKDHGEKARIQGVRAQGRLKDALEELERAMIKDGLKRTNWNKSRLAKELGISRAGLIMKVEKYGLDKRKIAKEAAQKAAVGE